MTVYRFLCSIELDMGVQNMRLKSYKTSECISHAAAILIVFIFSDYLTMEENAPEKEILLVINVPPNSPSLLGYFRY